MKAILFDLVGVLLRRRADSALSSKLLDIEERLCSATNDLLEKDILLKECSLTEESFDRFMHEIVLSYEPIQPVWDMMPYLNSFRRAIINNGTRFTVPAFRKTFHLDESFPFFVNSSILGMRKPEREIFEYAASLLEVSLQECLFIDDSPELTRRASEYGMKTICFSDLNQGLIQLRKQIGI